MALLITLIATPLVVYLLRTPLQRVPPLFYLLACVFCGVSVYLTLVPLQDPLMRSITAYLQQGNIPFSLFALVMFAGVFKEGGKLWQAFRPLRAELSILASILICGHIIPYLYNYASSFTSLASIKTAVLLSLAISLILVALLIPLFITSFPSIKKRMKTINWKRVQWLAYPFYALIYLHILGFLLPLTLRSNVTETISLVIYTLIFGSYAVLRIRASVVQKRAAESAR